MGRNPPLQFRVLQSSERQQNFSHNVPVPLHVIAGHHRKRCQTASAAAVERSSKIAHRSHGLVLVPDVVLDVGMTGRELARPFVNEVTTLGDRK